MPSPEATEKEEGSGTQGGVPTVLRLRQVGAVGARVRGQLVRLVERLAGARHGILAYEFARQDGPFNSIVVAL